jgi:hypothetical protein
MPPNEFTVTQEAEGCHYAAHGHDATTMRNKWTGSY